MFNIKSGILAFLIGIISIPGGVFADQGDFFPNREGISYTTSPYGTGSSVEFNKIIDAWNSVPPSRRQVGNPNHQDERDFTAARQILTDPMADQMQKYEHRVDNLELGDRVWVQIYVHNNAQQVCGGGNVARNTTARLDWSDPTAVVARITADNATPTEVNDIVSFSFAGDYSFQRIGQVSQFERIDPDAAVCAGHEDADRGFRESFPVPVENGVSSQINLGNVYGSYGYIKLLYFQLEVVPAERSLTVVQTSIPDGGNTVEVLSNINYTFTVNNTGNIGLENVVLTDTLDPNLEFMGPGIIAEVGKHRLPLRESWWSQLFGIDTVSAQTGEGVSAAGQVVTINYGDLGADPEDQTFTAQVRGSTPHGTAICNTGTAMADQVSSVISNELCHNVNAGRPDENFVVQKGAITPPGDSVLSPNEQFQYTLTVTNNGATPLVEVILTDPLPAQLSFISGDEGIVERNGVVTANFGTIAPGATITKNFTVQVQGSVEGITEICNAVFAVGQRAGELVAPVPNPTEQLCLPAGASQPRGGGGAPTRPTIGSCTVNYSTGAFQCTPRYPVADVSDPTYMEYRECVSDSTKTVPECLKEWAVAKEIVTCGDEIAGEVQVPYTGSFNTDIEAQCGALLPNIGGGSCTNGVNSTFIKKIRQVSGMFGEETSVAKGENVRYRATLEISGADVPEVTAANLRVYDFTIPAESGNVWNRNGFITEGWGWNTGGRYYEKNLSEGEINSLNAGHSMRTNLDYEMNTELAADYDVSNIKNVGFAVLRYNGGSDMIGVGEACGISSTNMEGIFMSSTLGDDANVNIIRPYVEAKGGDIGFRFSQNTVERITGDSKAITGEEITTGQVFVEEETAEDPEKGFLARFLGSMRQIISDLSIFEKFKGEAADSDAFYENLKLNLNTEEGIESLGIQFVTTKDESGVYFIDALEEGNPKIEGDLDLGGESKTFVIEDRDLIIGDITGIKTDYRIGNGFAAFVVRNGDIKIRPHVERIEGIFIVENGNIGPTGVYDAGLGYWVPEISSKQLNVSGMLVGDMQDLFQYRRFIGDSPEMRVEPSIKINFDLRVLENTPPALEKFLGADWRQESLGD